MPVVASPVGRMQQDIPHIDLAIWIIHLPFMIGLEAGCLLEHLSEEVLKSAPEAKLRLAVTCGHFYFALRRPGCSGLRKLISISIDIDIDIQTTLSVGIFAPRGMASNTL